MRARINAAARALHDGWMERVNSHALWLAPDGKYE
jgi:hypothetical protein